MIHQKPEHTHEPWSLANMLLLASGTALVGICGYLFLYAGNNTSMTPLGSGQVAKNETIVKNYTIDYPVFRAEKVDMMVRNYANHQVGDFLRRHGNNPRNHLAITYTIAHHDGYTATVIFNKKERIADQEVASQEIVTYDLQEQKKLDLADVFKDTVAAEAFLARIFSDYFTHDNPGRISPGELEKLARIKLDTIRDYRIDDAAIVFYIDLSTQVTISVKKELLESVLHAQFSLSHPSVVQRVSEQPTYAIEIMPLHDMVVNPGEKMLALTFDDGPGHLTPVILDALRRYSARATFFVIGRQVPTYAEMVRRAVVEGHEVGNHSWSHPNLAQLSFGQLKQQIDETQQVIAQAAGGYRPTIARPPQGIYSHVVAAYLTSVNLRIELWNVDTLDWLDRDAQVVYDRIMSSAADGRVILLHDIHPTSVEAAVRAIPQLVSQGYQLVTVSQLRQHRP